MIYVCIKKHSLYFHVNAQYTYTIKIYIKNIHFLNKMNLIRSPHIYKQIISYNLRLDTLFISKITILSEALNIIISVEIIILENNNDK